MNRSFRQAPFFYWLYTLLIVAGGAVVLIPKFPMVAMTILSQVLDGVLLPFVLYFMLKLVNKKELMGKHTNSRWFNWVAYATSVIVVGLTVGDDVAAGGAAAGALERRNQPSSLPWARSRIRVRSAARKSKSGSRVMGLHCIC